jgi:hypothetical protein
MILCLEFAAGGAELLLADSALVGRTKESTTILGRAGSNKLTALL